MSNLTLLGFTGSRSSFRLGLRCTPRSSTRSFSELLCASLRPGCSRRSTPPAGRRPDEPPLFSPISSRRRIVTSTTAKPWRATNALPVTTPSSWTARQRRTIFSSVIKHYVELPPNYEDKIGLPFRSKDLNQKEVMELFGTRLNTGEANGLLRILHGRRVAGSLEDPEVQKFTSRWPQDVVETALAYLRRTTPVDEIINAGLRAEDELREIEEAAERIAAQEKEREEGGSSSDNGSKNPKDKGAVPDEYQSNLYRKRPAGKHGRSVMDEMRAHNDATWQIEKARREEVKAKQEAEWMRLNPGKQLARHRDPEAPIVYNDQKLQLYYDQAQGELQAPPEMTIWQRLWPIYLLAGAFVVGGLFLGSVYAPPPRKYRVWPDIPPAAATVLGIFALNLAVFFAWKTPQAWRFLNRWFVFVPALGNRPIGALFAMFSHQKLTHLGMNSLFLWFFGTRLHDDVGRGDFLAAYLGCGVLAFAGMATHAVLTGALHLNSLGMSGAIYGISTAYFVLHRFEYFKIFGFPPDPYNGVQGLAFAGLMAGISIRQCMKPILKMDVWSHMFGLVAGVGYGYYFSWKKEQAKAAEKAAARVESDEADIKPLPMKTVTVKMQPTAAASSKTG